MLIGYARVSTHEQDYAGQIAALRAAGCEEIIQEATSGVRARPALEELIRHLRKGDILCVWKLDRLGRSLSDLLRLMERIEERGAGFRSVTEAIDTTSPAGRMLAHMLGAFAEFERSMIRGRTRLGLEAARQRGVRPGPKPKLDTSQRQAAARLVLDEGKTPAEVARLLGLHRSTIGRIVAQEELVRLSAVRTE